MGHRAIDGTDAATDAAEAVVEQGAGVELVSQGTNESASAVAIDANEEVAIDGADASTAAAAAVVAQGSVGVNETAAAIDEEVRKLVDVAYIRAKEVLVNNRHILDEIAKMLVEKETVDSDELQEILTNNDVKTAAFA